MRQGDVSPTTAANESEANRKAENEEMSLESTETERRSSINGNEDTQSSSCIVINVDLENSAYEYGDGDASSVLSSKTCSVDDVSLTGVQEEVKPVTLIEGCEEKVMSEARPDAVLEEVKQEPESVETEENVAVVSVPKLSTQSSSVSIEEEEGTAGLKQAESQDYINPRGVRFMSQEIGQDGEYVAFLFVSNVAEVEIRMTAPMVTEKVKLSQFLIKHHTIKMYGGVEVMLCTFLILILGGNALVALRLGKEPSGSPWEGCWMVPRASLDAAEKRILSFSCWNQTLIP
jgi:hypothetical protein